MNTEIAASLAIVGVSLTVLVLFALSTQCLSL
jgi:hypothetical protein